MPSITPQWQQSANNKSSAALAERPVPDSPAQTVLVIDDDEDLQANLRDILQLDGYQVEAATSIRQTLEHKNWADFHSILLDRRLPDGTAEELLPRIRQLAPHAAVMILTGHADLDSTIAALRHGAVDYILKPINPDGLRNRLARITQLREAERRAQQAERLAAIGQAMTFLAHEARNAFHQCGLSLGILDRLVKDLPAAQDQVRLIRKYQQMVFRLLEDTRQYAAPLTLQRQPCDLGAVLCETWDQLAALRAGREVRLHWNSGGVDLHCRADPFRIGQVFRNLLENSLAACPDPCVITVDWFAAVREGQPCLQLVYRDNGPGLNAEQRQKIFEPFFTTKMNGTGLGMAIARRILEAHGGEIHVGTDCGPGAEFILLLPRG